MITISGQGELQTPEGSSKQAALKPVAVGYQPLLALLCLLLTAGCANTEPLVYSDLSSASRLAPNRSDEGGHVPFIYSNEGTDWAKYKSFGLDPVELYRGPDQQFGTMGQRDRSELAGYMRTVFAKALRTKFKSTALPSADTLRIHLTLTGAEASTPVVSTLTKITPLGIAFNTVQTVRDKQAIFTGSVTYAAEIYDGQSGVLLRSFVSKQYPFAENVAASIGYLDAPKSGVRKGAQLLLQELH